MSSYRLDINSTWHTGPKITVTGTLTFSRGSESDKNIVVSGTLTNRLNGYFYGTGYTDTITIEVAGHEIGSWDSGKGYKQSFSQNATWRGDVWQQFECTDISEIVVYMHCSYVGGACPDGHSKEEVGRFSSNALPYNPYTPATIVTNSITPNISKLGDTYTVKYTITPPKGTPGIDWTVGKVYDTSLVEKQQFNFNNKSSGTFTNTIKLQNNDSVTYYNGTKYYVTTRCSDNKNEIESNRLEFFTYQKPIVNNSITIKRTTQTPLQDNSFTIYSTNNRAWTSLESDFQTRYRIKKGSDNYTNWTSLGNITTWTISGSEMKSLIPKTYDDKDIIIQMERYSPTSSWESDNKPTATFKVYYRPRMDIPKTNVTLRRNNSNGTIIAQNSILRNDSTLTGVNISWSYNTDSVDSGYTQGYRIRIYNAKGGVEKTYYTQSKNITIPKADIPKLQDTTIDITAYFGNDQANLASKDYANNYWYYNGTITKTNFVKIVSTLNKPVIDYPVQNGNWLNTDYRICFKLPEDLDQPFIGDSYVYENVEIQINGKYTIRFTDSKGTTTTGTLIKDTTCFSTTDLTHKKALVIYPNKLSSITLTAGSNTVKVRVKKKYGTNDTDTYWSDWSDIRTFNITPASYSVNVGDKILAKHFNDAKDLVDRVRNCYGVSWNNIPQNAISGTTIISTTQYGYDNMFGIIVNTKNKINTYGTFDTDKQDIKIDSTDKLKTTFTPTQEIVTAQSKEDNSPDGRNYMIIIYDRCNLLK